MLGATATSGGEERPGGAGEGRAEGEGAHVDPARVDADRRRHVPVCVAARAMTRSACA
jgi:hypothetical protein